MSSQKLREKKKKLKRLDLNFNHFGPENRPFFSMTGMSQVRGENPQEAPSAGELHSDLQVSDREVWERRSNSESVA